MRVIIVFITFIILSFLKESQCALLHRLVLFVSLSYLSYHSYIHVRPDLRCKGCYDGSLINVVCHHHYHHVW